MLSGLANSAAYDLVADKKFLSIEELRGTTLGVSGINSSSTFLLQKMLCTWPELSARLHTRRSRRHQDRLAAIKTGATSAGVLNPPISYGGARAGL